MDSLLKQARWMFTFFPSGENSETLILKKKFKPSWFLWELPLEADTDLCKHGVISCPLVKGRTYEGTYLFDVPRLVPSVSTNWFSRFSLLNIFVRSTYSYFVHTTFGTHYLRCRHPDLLICCITRLRQMPIHVSKIGLI